MRGYFIQQKPCWADNDYAYFLNKFFIKNNLHWKPGTSSYFFICLTYAVVCLLLLEFSIWKFFFWHAPNSPARPCCKYAILNCLQFVFASCWRVWCMSDTINILNLFLGPFMASWLPKLTTSRHLELTETSFSCRPWPKRQTSTYFKSAKPIGQ